MVQKAVVAEIRQPEGERRQGIPNRQDSPVFYGASSAMAEIREQLSAVAVGDIPVLLLGETGTGKEVIARAIHARSIRNGQPFVKLNCAAVPSELVESELFGHERGAFTGADRRKIGLFEMANGGTIFLDEIGDMEFRLQAKLLQVLQDQEFRRVGGYESVRVDVRLIAATHCDLEEAISRERFRRDLYYRLNVCCFRMPALRERKMDIVPLAEFLLDRHCRANDKPNLLTDELISALQAYSWPGNVRELENVIRKLVALGDPVRVARDIRLTNSRQQPEAQDETPTLSPKEQLTTFEEVIREHERAETAAIVGALKACRWNRKRAAAQLGIDYKALLYKMKKMNLCDSQCGTESALPAE